MNKKVLEFIRLKKINSVQKLNLLLLFHQNPNARGTSRCFAEKLRLGDTRLVDTIIEELADRGVITTTDQHVTLADTPETRNLLQDLAHAYEYPLSRQALLRQIQTGIYNGIN